MLPLAIATQNVGHLETAFHFPIGLHSCAVVSGTHISLCSFSWVAFGQGSRCLVLFATMAGTKSPKYSRGLIRGFCPSVSLSFLFTERTPLTLRGPKLPYTELTCLAPQISELINHRMHPEGISWCLIKGPVQVLRGPDTLVSWMALGWDVCV